MLNALTIDVEDYFHVTGFESGISRTDWDRHQSRVVRNTIKLLELLDAHGVKATFYVLGWVAERHPNLVEEIHRAGHEIGSHSYWHQLIYRQNPEEFRAELRRSRDVLEDIIGERVTAFRAPCFSITRESFWATRILVEEGFDSDSSIYPTYHDRYGIKDAPRHIHRIATEAGPLWEFPLTVARFAGMDVPVSGGGYFRLYPLSWTTHWLKQVNAAGRPFVFYIHPWEVDPDQPRLKAGSFLSRWRHYTNLSSTEGKLASLMKNFRFGRVADILQRTESPPARGVLLHEPRRAVR